MHCMAWLHEEPVYQLLVLLLLQIHLKTVILDIFSWMDFNVFYCNLVNILIHFFFSHYWFAGWVLPGWGRGREGEWNTPPLSLAVFQSLCPLSDQHSVVTAGEVTTWDPGLLLQPRGPTHASGTVAEQRTDLPHGGTAFAKGELTDSWEPTLPQLCFSLHVNSWVQCFTTPIFCLELKEAKTPVAHLFAVLLFRTVVPGEQMKTHHSWSWNKYPYATREGRASGNEMQMLLLVTEIRQTPTQVVSWLWQEGWLQSEALAVTSTVWLPALFRGVRQGEAQQLLLGKIQPVSLKRQYKTNNSAFILKGYPLFKCVEIVCYLHLESICSLNI